ncbi:hypothetical protein BDV98DRAFT_564011 [Pterulicium gracile]|uniref:DUF6534 domain-containing protein n=1 Tax=Pterulicium gracile TaxID=1884261 RepID=A0A5C3QPM0_9AGAR|nr:hypothetical protein BDV98DRAFT_564011 [Pterula gracilis]
MSDASLVNVSLTYGALLIGSLIATTLSGFVVLQCMVYLKLYSNSDRLNTQLMVLATWVLDLVHTIFVGMGVWHYTIAHFGNYAEVEIIHWTIAMTIVVTAVLTIMVHLFFARRIFFLSDRNWAWTAPILVLAVLRLASASATTGVMLQVKTFTAFKKDYSWLFTLGLALSSAVDALITTALCLLINTSRSAAPSSLNQLVDSLILYTLENGAITSLGTILSMICWITMSDNLIFMAMHFAITKLYANSFLVTLNVRYQLRRPETTISQGSEPGDSIPAVVFNSRRHPRRRGLTTTGATGTVDVRTGMSTGQFVVSSTTQGEQMRPPKDPLQTRIKNVGSHDTHDSDDDWDSTYERAAAGSNGVRSLP